MKRERSLVLRDSKKRRIERENGPIPTWYDGPVGKGAHVDEFNYEAAAAVYETISKLDDDSARMFVTMLAGDLAAHDLITGEQALAAEVSKHLDRYGQVLRDTIVSRYVSKRRNGEPVVDELAAARLLSKAFEGFAFSPEERARRAHQQQRDVATGRFVMAHHDVNYRLPRGTRALSPAQAAAMGIPEPLPNPGKKRASMSAADRLRYQTAYQQVAGLVRPYAGREVAGGGQALLHLQYANGAEDIHPMPASPEVLASHIGGRPATPIVGASVSVVPAGEAATVSPYDVLRDTGYQAGSYFTTNRPQAASTFAGFHQELGAARTNESAAGRLFQRIGAASGLLDQVTAGAQPPKLAMAVQAGQLVGAYGPEAQRVIGPTVDRAAYRYRGTERAPDAPLLRAFEAVDNQAGLSMPELTARHREREAAKAQRDEVVARHQSAAERDIANVDHREQIGELTPEQAHAERTRITAHRGGLAQAAEQGYKEFVAGQPSLVSLLTQRQARARALAVHGTETDVGWNPGPVLNYFRRRLPKPELNQLQLRSGVVPPSEGVIIDRKGTMTTQAVGYGDDWYLPFNLKHLSTLRGGEYLRTRSWGGPTTEDVYTGLMGGAQSLTVISNNGVYTMEFDRSFKGGRRYNDKAARMVNRYAHLLDAIQGTDVAGGEIHPSRLAELEQDAADYADPDDNPAGYQRELTRLRRNEIKRPTLSQTQRLELTQAFLDNEALKQRTPDGREMSRGELQEAFINREAAARFPGAREGVTRGELKRQVADEMGLTDPDSLHGMTTMIDRMGLKEQYEGYMRREQETYRRSLQPMELNGAGYEAALKALQEQFPYYIRDVVYHPWDDAVRGSDTGYVKPTHNRPALAQAGFAALPVAGAETGKVMADTTRYQAGHLIPTAARAGVRQQLGAAVPTAAATGAGAGAAGGAGAVTAAAAAAGGQRQLSPQAAQHLQRQSDIEVLNWMRDENRVAAGTLAPPGLAPGVANPMAGGHGAPWRRWIGWFAPGQAAAQADFHKAMTMPTEEVERLAYDDPRELHRMTAAAMETVRNFQMFAGMPADMTAKFYNGGREPAPARFDRNDVDAALGRLHRDFDFGRNYAPGLSAGDYEAEYRDNSLVDRAVTNLGLPRQLSAVTPEQINTARDQLRSRAAAWIQYEINPRAGTRPAHNPNEMARDTEGLARAAQLRRRWEQTQTSTPPAAGTPPAPAGPAPTPPPAAPPPPTAAPTPTPATTSTGGTVLPFMRRTGT